MSNIHHHYDQLTEHEREFVDLLIRKVFDIRKEEDDWNENPPPLANDDRCEHAVDALAQWVIESRREVHHA